MAFKIIVFFGLLAASNAGVVPAQVYHTDSVHSTGAYAEVPNYHAKLPVAYAHAPFGVAHTQSVLDKHIDEYDSHPQYKFGYDVQDSLSGDSKSQVEERDGDAVHGEYSVVDPDGFKRVVKYTSDPTNGFNAVVSRVPLEHVPVKTVFKAAEPVAFRAPASIVNEYPNHAYHH